MELPKDKQQLFFLTTTPECGLTFNGRLVYSELVRRAIHHRGASKTDLRKHLRLDPKTIARAIDELERIGLATCESRKFSAAEPCGIHQSWFRKRRNERKAWYNRIAYTAILKPSSACPLTARQNVILWLVHSLQKGRKQITASYLSRLLGIAPQTVKVALEKLQELNLLNEHNRPLEVGFWQLDWWQNAKKKPKKNERTGLIEEGIRFSHPESQERFLHLKEHGIPEPLAVQIVRISNDLPLDQDDFFTFSKNKLDFANKQRMTGEQTVDHHGHLLMAALKKQIAERSVRNTLQVDSEVARVAMPANFEEAKTYGERDILCSLDLRPQEGYALFNDICRIVYQAFSGHKKSDPLSVVSKLIEESLPQANTVEDFKTQINKACIRRGLPEAFSAVTA